eukprot:1144271-Pelagomonas_calceolata.AAC.4
MRRSPVLKSGGPSRIPHGTRRQQIRQASMLSASPMYLEIAAPSPSGRELVTGQKKHPSHILLYSPATQSPRKRDDFLQEAFCKKPSPRHRNVCHGPGASILLVQQSPRKRDDFLEEALSPHRDIETFVMVQEDGIKLRQTAQILMEQVFQRPP